MIQRISSFVLPVYILLAIVLGGSSQSPWPNLALQICGIAALAGAAAVGSAANGGALTKSAKIILLCGLVIVLIQLIPLPADVWKSLPGRGDIAASLAILGYPIAAAPISEMPFETLLTLFAAIPAIAAFGVAECLAPSSRSIAASIVIAMIGSVVLGTIQIAGGPASWAYFYPIHSGGAIGFFANGNHMGTLLVVGIPMAAALIGTAKSDQKTSTVTKYALGVVLVIVALVGIVLNGSRAALGLSVPILLASAALFPRTVRLRGMALGGAVLALVAGVVAIINMPMTQQIGSTGPLGVERSEIWSKTTRAVAANFPAGTGLGTFERVYHRYEDPADVTGTYVNHAHNDYLELALELGAPGILLITAFLAWWTIAATRIWTSPSGTTFGRAATIVTAAILAHSFVDFPLRSAAISVIFGACLALMANDERSIPVERGQRRTRHVKLG